MDESILFAPSDLDITITPHAVKEAISREEFTLAINMSLHLAEATVTREAVNAVPLDSIELVVKTIDLNMLKNLLKFIATELVVHSLFGIITEAD